MSRLDRLLRRSNNIYRQIPKPESLNANPMMKEGQLGAVVAAPLLALLFGIILYARYFAMTQEDFAIVSIVGMALWVVSLVGMYAYSIMQAVKYRLFDREFGYDSRLHPRCEIYCKPEDIRVILDKKDTVEKSEKVEQQLYALGFEKELVEQVKKGLKDTTPLHIYYFRHKDAFEGWDNEHGVIKQFKSHIALTGKSFTEQFEFSAGQENWYGPILYNHPSAESDNLKVLGWALDPFTSDPMPIGIIIHSTRRYNQEVTEEKQVGLIEAQSRLITFQHGMIENSRKELGNLQSMQDAKIHDVNDISKHGRQIAQVDHKLWKDIMKETSRGLLKGTWSKVLVTVAIIAAVVFLTCYLLGWINLSGILGGNETASLSRFDYIEHFVGGD